VTFNDTSFDNGNQGAYLIKLSTLNLNENSTQARFENVVLDDVKTNFLMVTNIEYTSSQANQQFNFTNMLVINCYFQSENDLIYFGGYFLDTSPLTIYFDNATFEDNNFEEYGNLIIFKQNQLSPIYFKDSNFQRNFGAMMTMKADAVDSSEVPLRVDFTNCSFTNNSPHRQALFVVNKNSEVHVTNSTFKENYSISLGSILMADYQLTKNTFTNCEFYNNTA